MKPSVVLLLFVMLAACSKDPAADNDNDPPIITITSPTPDQQYAGGQTVLISGELTDAQKISEVHVHISNTATGALLMDIHRYPAAPAYTLAETFQVLAGISYKIQVIAKDNSANESRASIAISSL